MANLANGHDVGQHDAVTRDADTTSHVLCRLTTRPELGERFADLTNVVTVKIEPKRKRVVQDHTGLGLVIEQGVRHRKAGTQIQYSPLIIAGSSSRTKRLSFTDPGSPTTQKTAAPFRSAVKIAQEQLSARSLNSRTGASASHLGPGAGPAT